MARQNTSLTFKTNGDLYPTGNTSSRFITTDKSLVADLSQSKKVGVSALNTDISGTLYLDAFFGFEVWANVGTTGTFEAEYDLEINVGLPNAVITPERLPGQFPVGAVMEFDFTDFDVTRSTISTVGFGRTPDQAPDPVAEAGIDLEAALAAGIRDAGFYGPIPGGIDNFDFPDIRFFGVNFEKDLKALGLSNTILSRTAFEDPYVFDIGFADGRAIQTISPRASELLKSLGELSFQAPQGANLFGSTNGTARAEALGVSDLDFLHWSIDVDRFITTILREIPDPRIQKAAAILKNTVFLDKEFSIGRGLDVLIKVVDLSQILTLGVKETLAVDLNRAGTRIPNIDIQLVSDHGTPNDPTDDLTTTGKLGEKLYLLSPAKGFGTAQIDATFSVDEARFDHEVSLTGGSYFQVDILQGRFGGSVVPDFLEFDFGPIFSEKFIQNEPGKTLGTTFTESFSIPGHKFNLETDTYEVFWVEDRLAPTDWDPEVPRFEDDVIDYFEASYEQLEALFEEYDTTGYILEPETIPDDLEVLFTQQPRPVLFGWTAAYDVRVLFGSLADLYLDGSRVLIGPRPTDQNGDPILDVPITVSGVSFDSAIGDYVEVLGPVAHDDPVLDQLALIDTFFTTIQYNYNGKFVQTNRTIDVIGNDAGDVLYYHFTGESDGYFDGGQNLKNTDYDVFIADLSFVTRDIRWDLAEAIRLENDGDNSTMGGITIAMKDGHELTVKNVEAAVLKTGRGDDYLVGGKRSDYFDTGAGDDIVRLNYFVPGGSGAPIDRADDHVRLGAGRDSVIVELGASRFTGARATDYIFGGEGADSLFIRAGNLGLRYDLFTETTSGTVGYLFGGRGLGADASLDNLGALVDGFNDDYVDNFGVFGDPDTRSKSHYLVTSGTDGSRIEISKDVEYVSVYNTALGPTGDPGGTGNGNDLVLFMNGSRYEGGAGRDTFAADFTEIDLYTGDRGGIQFWADAQVSYFGETVITGFERIWMKGTKVSDVIAGGGFSDHIHGGLGNDFLYGGFDLAPDQIFGGAGDDVFLWRANGDDVLDGGAGFDTLYVGNFDTPIDGTERELVEETGYRMLYYDADGKVLDTVGAAGFDDPRFAHDKTQELLTLGRVADSFGIQANGDPIIRFDNIEAVNMKGTDFSNDLMVYQGGSIYDAGERLDGKDKDVFFADFRFQRTGVEIVAPELGSAADKGFLLDNGVFIAGIEQLLIAGGLASDVLSGGTRTDVLLGGGGDDILSGGGGNDYLDGGDGNDQLFWDSQGKDYIYGGTNRDGGPEQDNLIINGGSGHSRVVLIDENGDDILSGRRGQAWTDSSREVLQELAENSLTADTWKYYNSTPGNPRNREDRSLRHVTYSEMESVDIAGTHDYDEVIVYQNGVAYVGGERAGDEDLFVADLRAFEENLFFDAFSASGEGYEIGQGTRIADFERFHLLLGAGDDRVIGGDKVDTVHGGAGDDWVSGGLGDDMVLGQGGNDFFEHSGGRDVFDGGAGASDVLSVNSRSTQLKLSIFDGDGAALGTELSMISDALSTDEIRDFYGLAGVTTLLSHGKNSIRFSNVEETLISASEGNDVLIGGSLQSALFGGGGDDALIGLAGNDFMAGGLGADIYAFDAGFGQDVIYGETAANTRVVFSAYARSELSFALDGIDLLIQAEGNTLRIIDYFADDANIGHNFTFVTTDGAGKRDFSGLGAVSPGAPARGITAFGTSGDDRPTNGTPKADLFRGFDGDDFFAATGGGDLFDGGSGEDAVSFIDATAKLRLDLANFVAKVGGGREDYLVSIERVLGTTFNDALMGDSHNNSLNGDEGNDDLMGRAGADTLIGGEGDDELDGGADDDQLAGDAGKDNLFGGAGNDRLLGGDGADTLKGGSEDDVLDGGAGNDRLLGGAGNDTLRYSGGVDIMAGGAGRDLADFSALDGTLLVDLNGTKNASFAPADTKSAEAKIAKTSGFEDVYGSQGDDLIIGNALFNRLDGFTGDDTLVGGKGADEFYGGGGRDMVDYSRETGASGVVVDLRDEEDEFGTDTFGDRDTFFGISTFKGTSFADRMFGSDNGDVFLGGGASDRLDGRAGDDELDGGTGNDELIGGEGHDLLIGGDGDDRAFGNKGDDTFLGDGGGTDRYDGGEGFDIVSYERTTKGVTFNLNQNEATGQEVGEDNYRNIEAYVGGQGDDKIGGSGNGDHYFYIGGHDDFDAKGGRDTLDFSRFTASVLVNLASGDDAKTGDGTKAPEKALRDIVTISSVEDVRGTDYDDILTGNAAANRLHGGKGDDLLDGGKTRDNDELNGDQGDDTIIGRIGAGRDTIDGGEGSDILDYSGEKRAVLASLEHGDGDDTVENVEWLLGTSFNDTLLGNDEANVLVGGKGRDRVFTGGGADLIIYTSGIDTVSGGEDSDTVDFGAFRAAVDVDLGNATHAATTGGKKSFDQGTQRKLMRLPELDVENAIGSRFDDRLTGNEGANILAGGKGDDLVIAKGGDDILTYDDGRDTWNGGGGSDTGVFAKFDKAIKVNLSKDTAQTAGGKTLANLSNIENIVGTLKNDVLTGDDKDNTLEGLSGDDQLFGKDGDDRLAGSLGDDILDGGTGADVLEGGEGMDTASYTGSNSAVTVDLALGTGEGGEAEGDSYDSIEYVTGSDHDDTLRGDGLGNLLDGGKGDDRLVGAGGDDTLEGGAGADTLRGGDGTDLASYAGAKEKVTVNLADASANTGDAKGDTFDGIEGAMGSSQNDRLIGDREANIFHGGAGNDSIKGGGGNDILFGGAGQDDIDGGSGADELRGGAGNDTYRVDDARDQVFEDQGGGTDLVLATSDFNLGVHVENLTLEGTAEFGTGNNSANQIVGSDADNVLLGLAGNDRMNGGKGADFLAGGAGNDVLTGGADRDAFAFAETFGQDRITDFDAGVDVLRLFASSGEARTFKAFKRASEDTRDGMLYDRGGDGENTILLQDVSLADLTKADLDFV
ncbi:hypothetical protein [Pseudooceanicola sp.]|uniref:hypothetical protein n=1 Tax=Pseudooceanicola sp. TaxID=1914328 RepID=UPI003519323B